MKREMLIFFALCVFADAMVFRSRRDTPFCAATTPCGWSVYSLSPPNHIESMIYNNYCICTPDTACLEYENDSSGSSAHRCLPLTTKTDDES